MPRVLQSLHSHDGVTRLLLNVRSARNSALQSFYRNSKAVQQKHSTAASERDADSRQQKEGHSPPRFHCPKRLPGVAGTSIVLSEDEARHATKALRLGSGAFVEVFDGHGNLGLGRLEVSGRQAGIFLEEVRQETWSLRRWTVAVAMSDLSSSRADLLVEKATELGAWSLFPFVSQHTHKGGADRSTKKLDRWRSVSLAACKQCRRLHEMGIAEPVPFGALLEQLRECQQAGALPLVALQGGQPLRDLAVQPMPCTASNERDVPGMIIVGPEGDFTNAEKQQMLEAGALAAGLGPLRLRVETAAIAALATLMLL